MLGLLFALVSLAWSVGQLQQAGWSLQRADRRNVYWGLTGVALGATFALRPVMPAPVVSAAVGGLGAACLYGFMADHQGWWTRRR